jgi:hypothetical protein
MNVSSVLVWWLWMRLRLDEHDSLDPSTARGIEIVIVLNALVQTETDMAHGHTHTLFLIF